MSHAQGAGHVGRSGEIEALMPYSCTPATLPPSPPSTKIDKSCIFPSRADIIWGTGHQSKANVKTIS